MKKEKQGMGRLWVKLSALLAVAVLALVAWRMAGGVRGVCDYWQRDFTSEWARRQDDVAQLEQYRAANRALIASADARPRIVLMGDSITYRWEPALRPAPPGLNLINRGIPGQHTGQMLLRFEDDVIALRPRVVVLLGGANDVRVYSGDLKAGEPAVLDRVLRNMTAMADIADARGVKVVLSAIPPIAAGHPGLQRDPGTIAAVNARLRALAAERHYPFVDYPAVLEDRTGMLDPALTTDGLHPTPDGYRRMWPLLEKALGEALESDDIRLLRILS